MRTLTTLTLTAGLALTLGACGSSTKSISKTDFITKGDAVCMKYETMTDSLMPPADADPSTAAGLKSLGAFLSQGESIVEKELADFKAVGLPSGDAAAKALVTNEENALADLKKAVTEANNGDVSGFMDASDKLTTDGDAADKAFDAYGFKECGSGDTE